MPRWSHDRRRYRRTYRRARRPKGVWWALAAGSAAALASALTILAPSVTVLAAAGGAGHFLRAPVGGVVLVVALGYGLAVTMIALTLRSQRTAPAWLCAAAGALIAVSASVYPLVATATVIAHEVGGFVPALDLLSRVLTS